ncbi:transmembrane signal receptor [Lithospermum erythrorhizon]|uniref:Transmembrane signal receptor n=1 Tax=Lithospermum erythrorhizon TaxID=34254 RepID=A0AAV3RV88_LITER
MDRLINNASGTGHVGSLRAFATEETSYTTIIKLFNLVQCTPDLSSLDCSQCLREALARRPAGPRGGRVLYYNLIVAIVLSITISIVLFTLAFCLIRRKAKKQQNVRIDATEGVDGNNISEAESLQYDLTNIKTSTNNFSADNKIGEGGFGEVFKGTLNGQQIAVKRLSKTSGQGEQEFKNEVLVVAKLEHRNLVRLLGYCLDEGEKILLYEFVPNKSLDFILFDQGMQQLLDWSRRYKIIVGVAKGILYLHEDSRLRIIHRDLKASNVLLDSDMNAKIADFGMARIVGADESQVNTSRVVGTFGYMSPEYALHGQFSIKSDVFSFGVLVLEIISGKKNFTFHQSGNSDDLLSYAWKLWRDGRPIDLLDPTLGDDFTRNEVIRCIHMGLLCVQEDPEDRPTMAAVVLMLSSYSVTLPLPHQPAFFLHSRTTPMPQPPNSDEFSSKSLPLSAIDESITELYPR